VVSPDFKNTSKKKRYDLLIDEVRKAIGDKPVDLVCYTPEEFERGSSSFLPSIIQEEGLEV